MDHFTTLLITKTSAEITQRSEGNSAVCIKLEGPRVVNIKMDDACDGAKNIR